MSNLADYKTSTHAVLDLNYITWMAKQWRRFRWLLWGATAFLWPLCLSGVVFLEAEATAVRLALLALLLGATGLCLYYTLESRRQLKKLGMLEKTAAASRAAKRSPKKPSAQSDSAPNDPVQKAAPPTQPPPP